MSDETPSKKPLSSEVIAETLGFTQKELDATRESQVLRDRYDNKFADAAEALMRQYTPDEILAFLDPIVDGLEVDDNPPTHVSPSGVVLTPSMTLELHGLVLNEVEADKRN